MDKNSKRHQASWCDSPIFLYHPLTPEEVEQETPLFTTAQVEAHSPDMCTDGECILCGILQCPFGEPLHFDADGCPVCDAPASGNRG
jgi:hypothetical protein